MEIRVRAGHLNQAPPEAPCRDSVLKNLIGRLIAKRPEDRPQDARAVLERLRRAMAVRAPVQEAIARGLGAHVAEQARAAAQQSAAQAAEDSRCQLIAQAKADLGEIVSDALSDLRDVEPDATSEDSGDGRWDDPSLTLVVGDVGLRIDLWEARTPGRPVQPVQDDTMVLAGCVMINNPRHPVPLNAANVVYEQVGDRLAWQIYRFSGGGHPDRYRHYGPYGRTHGLSERVFFDPQERAQMIRPAMFHPWTKAVTPLTAETLLGLFREAVDLRLPDPRTGTW